MWGYGEGGGEPARARARVRRYQAQRPEFSDRVVSLFAKGHAVRDLQVGTSALIGSAVPSSVIDAVLSDIRCEIQAWSTRALEPNYPIVTFERLRMKWRSGSGGRNMPCHFAIGIQPHGTREVLGFWIEGSDGPFWSGVLRNLKDRGVEDVFYFSGWGDGSVDGPAAFPHASLLPHVAELVRRSVRLATAKDAPSVRRALERLCDAANVADASTALDELEASALGRMHPAIALIWRRHWDALKPYLTLPREIRKVLASYGAADELRRSYKRALRGHGVVATAEDASALMFLAARDVQRSWRRPSRDWASAKAQLAATFVDRFDID